MQSGDSKAIPQLTKGVLGHTKGSRGQQETKEVQGLMDVGAVATHIHPTHSQARDNGRETGTTGNHSLLM